MSFLLSASGIDLSPECAEQLHGLCDWLRQVMDGVTRHELTACDEFEIGECGIGFVAVDKYERMTARQGAVDGFPVQQVHSTPALLQGHAIVDLSLEIAILADPLGADGFV